MKPRIGVTSCPKIHDQRPVEHVDRAYTDAVIGAGAYPFVLPVLGWADAEEVLSGLDGLLLTGGGDVAASCYGQDPSPEAYGVAAARDSWELALVAAARRLPYDPRPVPGRPGAQRGCRRHLPRCLPNQSGSERDHRSSRCARLPAV